MLNPLRTFRWAVYPSRDIEAGEVLDTDNLCVLRPNQGIDARDYVAGHHPDHAGNHHWTLFNLGVYD